MKKPAIIAGFFLSESLVDSSQTSTRLPPAGGGSQSANRRARCRLSSAVVAAAVLAALTGLVLAALLLAGLMLRALLLLVRPTLARPALLLVRAVLAALALLAGPVLTLALLLIARILLLVGHWTFSTGWVVHLAKDNAGRRPSVPAPGVAILSNQLELKG
jgi:hypothetical protein